MHKHFATKSHSIWTNKIESFKCDSRRLWTTVNHLMDIGKAWTLSRRIRVFLYKEVSRCTWRHWRFAASNFHTGSGCQFTKFDALICDDVTQLIRRITLNQSAVDPWPAWLLREYADDISPFITKSINLSKSSGSVLANLKEAYITFLREPTKSNYCNSLFAGLPAQSINHLQSILNASARLACGLHKYDHITPVLRDRLHWLPMQQRITSCLLTIKGIQGEALPYIVELCKCVNTFESRRRLRSAAGGQLIVPRTFTDFGKRAFAYAGQSAWNSLPTELRLIN